MSAIASLPADISRPRPVAERRVWTGHRLLTAGWMVFAALNVLAMWLFPGMETIPFHFVWISLTAVYGFTGWSRLFLFGAVAVVAIVTAAPLLYVASTGEIRWEEVAEVPLMSTILVAMAWHVWRRQRALAEVQQLAAAESRSARTRELLQRLASHELRTPITVARGYTELVRSGHPDPQTLDDTGVVLDELDKLAAITDRLVTVMAVAQPQRCTPTDLDEHLGHLIRRWSPTADRRWSIRSAAGVVPVDPDRLETALDCVLHNAVKFTGPGDRIAVDCRRDGESILIQITDSGCGYAPGRSPADQRCGSGLGLAIARAIVEARGGRISIEGRPGAGTTVLLDLPLRPPFEPVPRTQHQDGVLM